MPATIVVCYILGMGGLSLDPGGATSLRQRFLSLFAKLPLTFSPRNLLANLRSHRAALQASTATTAPLIVIPDLFTEEAVATGGTGDILEYFKTQPAGSYFILVGDSCGANKLGYIAAYLKSLGHIVLYAAAIQASFWCKFNWPGIPDNVRKFKNFYSSWALTFGLGVYQPPLVSPPNNNGKTIATYVYTPDVHPGDNDVTGVQNPILADVKEAIASVS